MLGMSGANWVGLLMLVIVLVVHQPLWLFIFSDSTNIVWAILVALYVIVAVVLLLREGPDHDET